MGLFSFSRYIIMVLLLSAAILAMQPYQISADNTKAGKLASDHRLPPSPPPPPLSNVGPHIYKPPPAPSPPPPPLLPPPPLHIGARKLLVNFAQHRTLPSGPTPPKANQRTIHLP
ncbi:hypothetical protein I3843_15G115800 [Carya illinoinensis]|nr:hypothetical protein I3843_15G115800 [Carya illinoinensis]